MRHFFICPILLLAILPFSAKAEDLCESRASIHQRAIYCHENLEFLAPAQACTNEFSRLVAQEKARLQKILNGEVSKGDGAKQRGNFDTGKDVFASSLEEVNYLLDFGKQVHTELEDYVGSLTPPVFDAGDAGDPNDPSVKARYMESSECYSDPVNALEEMQVAMRPTIAELERVKAQLTAMAAINLKNDSGIENQEKSKLVQQNKSLPKALPIKGKDKTRDSDVTGKSDDIGIPKNR